MRYKRVGVLLLAGLIYGCATQPEPTIDTGETATVVDEHLYPVRNIGVDYSFVDPDAEFSSYQAVWVDPLFVDRVVVLDGEQSPLQLHPNDRERLKQRYQRELHRILKHGPLLLTDEPGREMLKLSVALLRISSNSQGRPSSITITGMLSDAQNGKVLAKFVDTQEDPKLWAADGQRIVEDRAGRLFAYWAKLFRKQLDYWQQLEDL